MSRFVDVRIECDVPYFSATTVGIALNNMSALRGKIKVTELPASQGCEVDFEIRKFLCLHHGHIDYVYGDDGELQCHKCNIDFKRDTFAKIYKKIQIIPKQICDKKYCEWTYDGYNGKHNTQCGNESLLLKGYKYCFFCGKEILADPKPQATPVDISLIEVGDEVKLDNKETWYKVVDIKDTFIVPDCGGWWYKDRITAHRKK